MEELAPESGGFLPNLSTPARAGGRSPYGSLLWIPKVIPAAHPSSTSGFGTLFDETVMAVERVWTPHDTVERGELDGGEGGEQESGSAVGSSYRRLLPWRGGARGEEQEEREESAGTYAYIYVYGSLL